MKQFFESDRIRFTEVSELLVSDYLVMVNDYENVNRFIGSRNKTYTAEQELEWVRKKQAEKAPVFSMLEKESGRFIGNIELMDLTESEGELGIAITAGMQDRGYGSEAVSALVRYAFDHLGLKRIVLRTKPYNARAVRVYEKCGFREYGRTEDHIFMEINNPAQAGAPGKEAVNYLEEHYKACDEDGRLLSRHGQVEYLTTMKYIKESLAGLSDPAILEIGAGTGRYSVTLARQGFRVTAVELTEHNLDILRSKLDGTEPLRAVRGNALDLSAFADDSFDLTMLLGPMYHLYTKEDQLRALSEAVRVTKPGGHILAAYCMNEPTVIQYVFGLNHLHEVMALNMLTPDWHCISEPKDLFQMVRTEEIAALDAKVPVRRIKLVATDGATNYMRESIDAMDDETFARWMDYHFTICERQDLIGASHHTLDILQKI